jgi:outer membrane protein OmpA-like peptidoglycan-associated protein
MLRQEIFRIFGQSAVVSGLMGLRDVLGTNSEGDIVMATYVRKPLPIDHKKSKLWAIASLGSAGIAVAGVQLFDLFNRETNRAHRVELTTGGVSLGVFGASFGASEYVNFTTPRPVNFFDFNDLRMTVRETNAGLYSWTTVSFWGMSVKIAGGGANIPGLGVSAGDAKVLFSDGRPKGDPDYIFSLPPGSDPNPPRTTETAEDEKLVFRFRGDALFGFDKYLLKPDRKTNDTLVSMTYNLSSWSLDHRFLIVGHTDSIGSSAYNKILSKRRAETILAWIKKNTTHKPEWFKTEGRGKDDPVASNATEAGRAANRRVEIYGMLPRIWKHH